MSYLETSPNSISTLSESFLFGGNFEPVKRQVDQDIRKFHRDMPAPLSGESIIGGQASTKATSNKDRWITVEGIDGPIRIDRATLTPWQQAWYQANQYIEREDWLNAVESIREAIRLRPNPPLIWALYTMLGIARVRLNHYDGAIIALSKAIEMNPSDGITQFALGSAYLMLYLTTGNRNKLRKAVRPFRAAIKLGHNKAHCYLYLGLSYSYLEHWQEAETAYQKAINIQRDLKLAYLHLAKSYLHLARRNKSKWKDYYLKAVKTFRQLAAVEPGNSSVYNFIGFLYTQFGDAETAAQEFKKAVDADGNNLLALGNLGFAYLEIKRFEDAKSTHRQIINSDLQPLTTFLTHELGWSDEAAVKGLERFLSDANTGYGVACAELYGLRLIESAEEGKHLSDERLMREAEAAFLKAIELSPANTHAHYDLAVLYYQQNRPEEAKETIRRLLAIEPNSELIRQQVQRLLQEQLRQRLLAKGVVKEIRSPITDFKPYRNRMMMTIRGKPLSQLVIEGRR